VRYAFWCDHSQGLMLLVRWRSEAMVKSAWVVTDCINRLWSFYGFFLNYYSYSYRSSQNSAVGVCL
jgi:hypothetical protein